MHKEDFVANYQLWVIKCTMMLGWKVTMEIENTNVYHAQIKTYKDKHKYKHSFSIAQSNMEVEQDMRLRNKLQNYWRKINWADNNILMWNNRETMLQIPFSSQVYLSFSVFWPFIFLSNSYAYQISCNEMPTFNFVVLAIWNW